MCGYELPALSPTTAAHMPRRNMNCLRALDAATLAKDAAARKRSQVHHNSSLLLLLLTTAA